MKENLNNLISQLNRNNAPDDQDYMHLLQKIDFVIDPDFMDFIHNNDGAEGEINKNNYITLWNIADLLALNPYYEDVKECESLFFFGTDGSNQGFAFDKKTGDVVNIDFLDITHEEPKRIASSFEEFIESFR